MSFNPNDVFQVTMRGDIHLVNCPIFFIEATANKVLVNTTFATREKVSLYMTFDNKAYFPSFNVSIRVVFDLENPPRVYGLMVDLHTSPLI